MTASGSPRAESSVASGPVKIAYLDGPRLRRVLLAAHRHLASRQAELDRINVFPVADGDTGTNPALTFREVADLYDWLREIRAASRRSLGETPEALPVLREAGVVDAGAKGFVTILEAALCYVEGRPLTSGKAAEGNGPAPRRQGSTAPTEVRDEPEEGAADDGRAGR